MLFSPDKEYKTPSSSVVYCVLRVFDSTCFQADIRPTLCKQKELGGHGLLMLIGAQKLTSMETILD